MIHALSKRARHNETGAVAVMVTLFIVALFGFAALSIDVSHVFQEERRAQAATDAAAYAGVALLTNAVQPKIAAIQEAQDIGSANGITTNEISASAIGQIQVGQWDTASQTFTPDATPYNAVRVPARRTVPLAFGRVVGMTAMNPAVRSVANLSTVGRVANPIPFGVSVAQLTNSAFTFGSIMTLNDNSIGSGKQGKIDLANYANTPDWQADMTTSGCGCDISVGTIPTITGNAQVDQSFNSLGTGAIFIMPVVDQFDTTGSKPANIIGFVVVQLLSSSLTGKNWTATVQFLAQSTGETGGGSCPPPCVQARFLAQ